MIIATHNFPPRIGGIEQYSCELARALSALGVRPTVIAPEASGAREFDRGEPYAIERYAADPWRDLDLVRRLEAQGRAASDLLCMQWTAAPWPALRRRITGQPRTLAIVCHGKDLLHNARSALPAPLFARAARAVLGAASHVVAVSAFTAELARARAGVREVHVVHPGVAAERFTAPAAQSRPPEAPPCLLSVSRLVPRKGIDTVLRALPALLAQHPRLRYRIAGDGEDRPRLEALARELGVRAQIELLGRVPDAELPALYAAADLFAFVSRAEGGDVEGFGLACLEAQAAGLPVVAGRAGGVPEALRDGVTGVLVDPLDSAALAGAIGALFADPARRARMAAAARAHAAAHSWSATARRLLEVLGRGASP